MKPSNQYRGARRNEARARGIVWRFLDNFVDGNGTRRVRYPFAKNGKTIPGKIDVDGQ